MSKNTKEAITVIQKYFATLTDPRQQSKVRYNLLETIVMVICAVIADCDVWEDIADYCRVKETLFREALSLKLQRDAERAKSAEERSRPKATKQRRGAIRQGEEQDRKSQSPSV